MFCLQHLTHSCINELDSVPEGQRSLPAKKPPEARGGWPFLMNGLLWGRYRPDLSKCVCNSELNLVSNIIELQHGENITEVFPSDISKPNSLNFLMQDCLESLQGSLWVFGTSPAREQSSSSLRCAGVRLCKDPSHQALRSEAHIASWFSVLPRLHSKWSQKWEVSMATHSLQLTTGW